MGTAQNDRQFAIVVAHDSNFGIGKNARIPWKIDADRILFRDLTRSVKTAGRQNLVMMGRRTWESIPPQNRPLKERINLVLTQNRSLSLPKDVIVCHSMEEAMKQIDSTQFETCFAIGGASIYDYALKDERFGTIHLTEISGDFQCDVFFPRYKDRFALLDQAPINKENGQGYRFCLYKR